MATKSAVFYGFGMLGIGFFAAGHTSPAAAFSGRHQKPLEEQIVMSGFHQQRFGTEGEAGLKEFGFSKASGRNREAGASSACIASSGGESHRKAWSAGGVIRCKG